jgi:Holliday junction resolvase RusA-like endonuclease
VTVTFTIPQQPRGKSRHATVVTLRCGKCQRQTVGQRSECPHCGNKDLYFMYSHEYTDKDQREYERFAAMCAQQGMQGHEKFVGPVWMHCDFYFEIPKSRIKKLKDGDWHTQRPDTDNCLKSTDAFMGLCFADDAIVSKVSGEKHWTTGAPRTEVRIESLDTVSTNGA